MSKQRAKPPNHSRPAPAAQGELVDPTWMLKALASVVVLALVCGYVTICALFYRAQWQLVLSPSRTLSASPAKAGLSFEDVRFGPGAAGEPELNGWWLPAMEANAATVLVLHAGSGTMSDVLPQARLLHDNDLSVLMFDYRGFGKSSGKHPTEQMMEQDAEAALHYLNDIHHVPTKDVIVFGEGLGASLATGICAKHHEMSALILENADGDFESRVALDTRSRIVPVGLLFNQRFPLADPLHALTTPKLLISYTKSTTPPLDFARAADPKLTVELASTEDTATWSATLRRFLDSYVMRPPPMLKP